MAIGTTHLVHIAILVKDIEQGVANWMKFLGITEKPRIWTIPPPGEALFYSGGRAGDYSDCKLSVLKLENVNIELVEPGPHSGPFKEALDKKGEGLQHLAFIVPDRRQAQETLKELGAPEAYHVGYYPDGTYSFVDSTAQLGVEINIKTNDDNREKIEKIKQNPGLHKQDL
jgi:catechol 2,3-dioxygenase-like lactoylglutathione lyase family enzyme